MTNAVVLSARKIIRSFHFVLFICSCSRVLVPIIVLTSGIELFLFFFIFLPLHEEVPSFKKFTSF